MLLFTKEALPTKPSDLVWIQTGFIGDIVLTTAALAAAQKKFPQVRQHVITTRAGVEALSGHPHVATVASFRKSGLGLKALAHTAQQIRGVLTSSTAVTLQPHLSFRSSLLRLKLALPSITFHETTLGFTAHVQVPRTMVLHEAQRIGLLLEPLGINREEIAAARPFLPVEKNPESLEKLAGLTAPLIGIAPGSVWATKMWTKEGFIALAQQLLHHYSTATLVFLGSAAESALVQQITTALTAQEQKRTLNLAGQTSLKDLRTVLPQMKILIAHDSSLTHFGSALNVPTVTLFGATVPALGFAPLAEKNAVVEINDLACRPCHVHGPQRCPLSHFECMRRITPSMVMEKVEQLLQLPPASANT